MYKIPKCDTINPQKIKHIFHHDKKFNDFHPEHDFDNKSNSEL